MAIHTGNHFLDALSASDRKTLSALSKPVAFETGAQLYDQSDRIQFVFFPVNGVISLRTVMRDGFAFESAVVGQTTAIGLTAVAADPYAPSRAFVLSASEGLKINALQFQKAVRANAGIGAHAARHQDALIVQIQQISACNGLHRAEQRLIRWLLQTEDFLGASRHVPLTHESLAFMLGVKRTTVTILAGTLQDAGLIRYRRGQIQILERAALEMKACECYGVVRRAAWGPL